MTFTIASFELRQRLRRISTYVYFLVFLLLGFLFANVSGGAFSFATVEYGTGGKVLVTSPYALSQIIIYVSVLGIVITGAIAGQATFQDIDTNSSAFFYTSPITKFEYLAGRFLGALAVQVIIFSSVGLGAFVGTLMPWLDQTRVGPELASAYLQPYLIGVLPNLVLTTAIFFGLAALGKRMLPVYAGSVILLIGYFVASQLSSSLSASNFTAMADPFGLAAIDRITMYWTPFERNTHLIPFEGALILNRVFWLMVGIAILGLTYLRFSVEYSVRGGKSKLPPFAENETALPTSQTMPVVQPRFSTSGSLQQLVSLTAIQFRETVKNIFFAVLLLAGFVFAVLVADNLLNPFATPTYPVTYSMLQAASGGFFIFVFAIITFYSGELTWRERDAQLNQIVDALPVQRWVLFTSKLLTLMLVQVIVVLLIMAAGVFVQTLHGYHRFEVGLYLKELFGIRLPQYWMFCVLALLVQTVISNKYLGYFVTTILLVTTLIVLPAFGLEDYLYRFGQAPPFIYSDMNGYGPFAKTLFWFLLYWGIAAIVLALLTNLLWVRGTESAWGSRFRLATARLSRTSVAALATCVILWLAVGGYIFYNTHVLNPYRNSFQVDEARAQYEKKYKKYEKLATPKITDIKAQVDIDPQNRSAELQGTITAENKTDQNVDRIALTLWPGNLFPLPMPKIEIRKLSLRGGQTPLFEDRALGFYLYQLPAPLPPHGQVILDFSLKYPSVGFVNSRPNTDIVRNGTFMTDHYMPLFGYVPDIELTDDSARHRHGLHGLKRLPKLADLEARQTFAGLPDADWIRFEGTVSTSANQIAIMPGYLQKEWTENGRRYFHYKMDAPIIDYISINSARYAIRRDKWNGVNLEIYYHPGHEFDLDRMMDGMKASLAYCSASFSPYQFHQLRILEFPRYGTFAESFANTIPFSEAIGFITYTDESKPDFVDLSFYVTAHETAHQWWGHQVMAANVEGQTSIVETLAQYSALMVMKHRYGDRGIRRFLRFELDRYLRGRAQERNEELPLYRVDSNQGYIHYNKGALVMYALQDYVGEDKINQALAAFVKKYAFQGPPYPVSTDLIAYFKQVTPPEYQYLYDDLWEHITLYDNRVKSATATRLPDGKYQVKLVVDSRKLRSDGNGREHEVPEHDWMDVGVQDASGSFLYLQKSKIEQHETELSITVDKPPARAGIDPLDKLIDRAPDDNVVDVKLP
jgi:ABC-2 type transport system permease protein